MHSWKKKKQQKRSYAYITKLGSDKVVTKTSFIYRRVLHIFMEYLQSERKHVYTLCSHHPEQDIKYFYFIDMEKMVWSIECPQAACNEPVYNRRILKVIDMETMREWRDTLGKWD